LAQQSALNYRLPRTQRTRDNAVIPQSTGEAQFPFLRDISVGVALLRPNKFSDLLLLLSDCPTVTMAAVYESHFAL
jgi:hypothetical protein